MTPKTIATALHTFRNALAAASEGEAGWLALQALAQEIVGARLFTVTAVDMEAGLARRLYTNMHKAYPVSGTKPIEPSPWFDHVIGNRRLFVMNTYEEIAEHFFDHELIRSLGCGSCVNMPVILRDSVVGTVNLLDVEHHFTPERVALVERLQLPALAVFVKLQSGAGDETVGRLTVMDGSEGRQPA
jgi:hypothetical protein